MTSENRVIEPCPFCGSNNLGTNGYIGVSVWVDCRGCRTMGPTVEYPPGSEELNDEALSNVILVTEGLAVDRWNVRGNKKHILRIGSDHDE